MTREFQFKTPTALGATPKRPTWAIERKLIKQEAPDDLYCSVRSINPAVPAKKGSGSHNARLLTAHVVRGASARYGHVSSQHLLRSRTETVPSVSSRHYLRAGSLGSQLTRLQVRWNAKSAFWCIPNCVVALLLLCSRLPVSPCRCSLLTFAMCASL